MITKEHLLQSIKDLPESFSLDELLDRIILLQKIEIGLVQSASNQVFTTEEAKEKLKRWLP
jgi:hypothetical protein